MDLRHEAPLPFRHPDKFYIGGHWVRPASDGHIDVIDPSTELVAYTTPAAGPADVEHAVATARTAFDDGPWPTMEPIERAGYLRAIAAALRRRTDDFAMLWSRETGAVYSEAVAALATPPQIYEFYADLAESFEFVEHFPDEEEDGIRLQRMLVREPVGVVAAILPWNGTTPMIAMKAAPALLAGCTVVVKCSPEAPGAGQIMAEIAEEVGLPPGVWNAITADRAESEMLVRDHRIDKVTFTGSTAAGRRIGSICGERIARCTLELGGKSAAVVMDDYDIAAVAKVLSNTWRWGGQVCAALTRVMVTESRHDEIVDALRSEFSGVAIGDPFDSTTQMGPLSIGRQRDRVEGFIRAGIDEGAQLVTGGKRPAGLDRGFFVEPTLFARVDNASTIAQQEIFGPVLAVVPAKSEEHAVELANQSAYGLNASVFTNDTERAFRIARKIRSGSVGHNGFRTDWRIAFGGFKDSGIGRECGREGLYPFLEPKTVVLEAHP
ncbi:aldehyde dehydrogenase (NAD+) [Rhodococcus sp. 27YEA15]|uniref:aldehyde dehydrogenase n=1 Tax=Rhodococcus sp. 27YEA15 TaxID=3156259 RepID=UPI003C7CF290